MLSDRSQPSRVALGMSGDGHYPDVVAAGSLVAAVSEAAARARSAPRASDPHGDQPAPFAMADHEPEDVDMINAAARVLVGALLPRQLAELAGRLAEETDCRVAALDLQRLWPEDPACPLNPLRAIHRAELRDHIEAALR